MPIKEKYINLLTDFGFKKLFGTEANKDLLIDFLNELLPEEHQIENLTYADKEQVGDSEEHRKAIYDIYCTSKKGEHFIVELQRTKQEYFKDRSIYYSSHVIHSQGVKGNWDFKLAPVYTISILDFTFEDSEEDSTFIHRIQLRDEEGKTFFQKLTYIYIELPKFTKKPEELETRFEKWLFVFRWIHQLQKRPQALQERVFRKLFSIAEIAKFNKMERTQYQESLKHYRDLKNSLTYAQKQGWEEGKEKGRKEGRKEGREEGREERNLEIIKNGLEKGYAIELIADLTNLSIPHIQEIIKDQGWKIN